MIRMEIKTRVLPADEAGVAEAAQLLRQGQLVALPTETVYGIAADARNGAAVRNIFVAKGRPQDNPLIVHVTGPEMLPGLVSEVPERAQLLMAAFCPGPLTIIMPRGPEVADECCAGLDTVGIRMPSHPVARAVIQQSGCAFAAPSANLSGKPSPTHAQDVLTDMDVDLGRRRVRCARGEHRGVGGGREAHPVPPGAHHAGGLGARTW